jgi:hypothetical protein
MTTITRIFSATFQNATQATARAMRKGIIKRAPHRPVTVRS